MGIQNLIEDVKQLKGEAGNKQRCSFELRWREVAVFVIDPNGGPGTEVKVISPSEDSRKFAGFLSCVVERSNERDFPNHRFYYGSILEDGKFVNYVEPVVLDKPSSPVVDDTFVADTNLHVYAEIWHGNVLKDQIDAYVTRTSAPVGKPDDKFNKAQTPKRVGKTERDRTHGKAAPKKS